MLIAEEHGQCCLTNTGSNPASAVDDVVAIQQLAASLELDQHCLPVPVRDLTMLEPNDYACFVKKYRIPGNVERLLATLREGVVPLDIPVRFNDTTNRRALGLFRGHLQNAGLADETIRFLQLQRKRRHDRLRKREDRQRYNGNAKLLITTLQNAMSIARPDALVAAIGACVAADKCARNAVPLLTRLLLQASIQLAELQK